MRNLLFATICLVLSAKAAAGEKCAYEIDAIMEHEQTILAAVKDGKIAEKDRAEVFSSLSCIVEIQQKSSGFTKYVANSFMQTFLGAGQIHDVPTDRRYTQVTKLLEKMAEYSKDPAHMLLLEAHSRGEWGLYSLMCEKGSTEYCSDFLPETKKIVGQSPLVAASSMLLLKTAFFKLGGEQQRKVAERIRELHRSIDKKDKLKRRVIDAIFEEIFPRIQPYGLLG